MRFFNNRNNNSHNNKKRTVHRIASALVSGVIMANSIPYDGIYGLSKLFKAARIVDAYAEGYIPKKGKEEYTDHHDILFNDKEDLLDYAYYYQNDSDFAKDHKTDTLKFGISEEPDISGSFQGIGTLAFPFSGKLKIDNDTRVKCDRAFFKYLSDTASIEYANTTNAAQFVFTRTSDVGDSESKPVLADHVTNGDGTSQTWMVKVEGSNSFSGAIGDIADGAEVSLIFTNVSTGNIVFNGDSELTDAGLICGAMGDNSKLTLEYTGPLNKEIASKHGDAGGLVGTMGAGADLAITSFPNSAYEPTVTAKGTGSNKGYAGGLVGNMSSTATITDSNSAISSIGGTVKGYNGAGGYYGKYGLTGMLDLSNYSTTATVHGTYCGGLFGELEADGDLTITDTAYSVKSYSSASSGEAANNTVYFGGVIGKLTTTSLSNTILIQDLKVSASPAAAFKAVGGVFGTVNSAAYVQINSSENKNVEITASNVNDASFFGGIAGATSESQGVFFDFYGTTSTNYKLTASYKKGGGIVGQFNNGVLRLSGTTDLSAVSGNSGESCGQLVGYNDNVLAYALGTGSDANWKFIRPNGKKADDLGTWGEVLRSFSGQNAQSAGIVTVSGHTATIAGVTADATDGDFKIGTTIDFAKTALNIQLNQGSNYGCLEFASGSATRSTLLAGDITLTNTDPLSLAGTGINSLMRDGASGVTISATGNVGEFTGTFDGKGKTITFATGESYGRKHDDSAAASGEGSGQIYRHMYTGLFSVIGRGTTVGTVKDLTINGDIYIRNAGADNMSVGGISARSHGSTTLEGITAEQIVYYYENGSSNSAKYIGGLIGFTDSNTANGTVYVKGTTNIKTEFSLENNTDTAFMCGGAIGAVLSPAITVDFATDNTDVLNDSMKVTQGDSITNSTSSQIGGLIGYIASGTYTNRTVNITNVKLGTSTNELTIKNKASSSAGGLLGYKWLDTTVVIDGLEVVDASLNYSAKNVGVVAYEASGKWTVDSLTVSKLSVAGGSDSIGMLVNKAYSGSNGLYLDVLNSGYTLTEVNITLPTTLKIFDELAAYSAPTKADILAGGYGVISINTNARNGAATISSTYQNKLALSGKTCSQDPKFANPTSRYYYNLSNMSKTNAGQNLVLWSVKKYAAENISSEFDTSLTDSTLSGTADISNLSFYPVNDAGGCTINGLNVTFGYSSIITAEGTGNTDSYIRDPGDSKINQHYLMQSGLFIDLPESKTLTISGPLTLGGNFLETDTYRAVLISNEMRGKLSCTGLISLNGITPKYRNSSGTVETYSGGYLLINKIRRQSDTSGKMELKLKNVSTSSYTEVVAKSLIGSAEGPELNIELSKIKLDPVIFSESTLLNSIKTDSEAQLKYTFTYADDWGSSDPAPHNVTYGKELSESKEYEHKELRYASAESGDRNRFFVNPTTRPNASSGAQNFSSYKPYVFNGGWTNGNPYTGTAAEGETYYYRELKVNVEATGLKKGCGTYNDPYIIENGEELESVAEFLKTGQGADLGTVILPKSVGNQSVGARWCTSNHAEYDYQLSGDKFTSTADGAGEWGKAEVQKYLAASYYVVEESITLGSSYVGLGGKDSNTAFRGVIIGKTDSVTITNGSKSPFINVSNGSVIKDLTIAVDYTSGIPLDQAAAAYNTAAFGYESVNDPGNTCKYYGGIIGEIMGGDNIIDNSYVEYTSGSAVKLSGAKGTIVPVGGYVGVVVYGGLIFKNMTANKTTQDWTGLHVTYGESDANLAAAENYSDIYANPIVGRVINGYVVNETTQFSTSETSNQYRDGSARTSPNAHTLKNGKKHYTIADINKNDENKLDVTQVASASQNGNINVPNSQAMFILSLITQSCAGTAAYTAGAEGEGDYSDSLSYGTYGSGTSEKIYGMSRDADYTGVGGENITQELADYKLASADTAAKSATPYIIERYTVREEKTFSDIHTVVVSEMVTTTLSAKVSAVVHGTETTVVHSYVKELFTGASISNGSKFVIKGTRTTPIIDNNDYMTNRIYTDEEAGSYVNNRNSVLLSTYNSNKSDAVKLGKATEFTFEQNTEPGHSNEYCIYYLIKDENNNDKRQYLTITEIRKYNNINTPKDSEKRGNIEISETPSYFELELLDAQKHYWLIKNISTQKYINYDKSTPYYYGAYVRGTGGTVDAGNKLALFVREEADGYPQTSTYEATYTTTSITTSISTYTTTAVSSYTETRTVKKHTARCVTVASAYYNINLTGTGDDKNYVLPDSFRGIGCVGIYDSEAGSANKYSMKLNTFDGKGCTIDADIYLNKFLNDNYFNRLHSGANQVPKNDTAAYAIDTVTDEHGIGLFDSVIMKTGGKFNDFTLKGSVKTEIYDSGTEFTGIPADNNTTMIWHSTGGVCGWSRGTQEVNFNKIKLDGLSVYGSNYVAGLLAHSGNNSDTVNVTITECSSTDISITMAASEYNGNPRNAMGAFVGKVKQGKVIVYGTQNGKNNNTSNYSEVKINSFAFGNSTDTFYVSVGGLVGYSGHGFEAYDMKVSAYSNDGTTIGNAKTGICGGIVGVMQPFKDGNENAEAMFKNCTVQNISIQGNMAGGIYGGKWDSTWVPYRIELDKCTVSGKAADNKNSIIGGGYAGGLVGNGLVYTRNKTNGKNDANIIINQCKVENYSIYADASKYSGGFVGYCDSKVTNSAMTCYIHDSSVENCVIGQSRNDYAGGAIGGIAAKTGDYTNEMLGYNIKLDNVTSPSSQIGAWVGKLNDTKTVIQFTGMAVYGSGFTKNIGSGSENANNSFVYASYEPTRNIAQSGVSSFNKAETDPSSKPTYPYVNVNPQSDFGSGEVISGDGAVLYDDDAVSDQNYTAAGTMAQKIYTESKDTNNSRCYSTFSDTAIKDDLTIGYYMQRTVENDGDRISTYSKEKGSLPIGVDDFAVVVIANTNHAETTALINRYIQLVTNTSGKNYAISNDYYNVDIKTCSFNGTKFTINDNQESGTGLIREDGQFKLNNDYADSLNLNNNNNTFTLVDVQFKDPFNIQKIAYHLYVPVYTIREMTVQFKVAAKTGTHSAPAPGTNPYEELMDSDCRHNEVLDTWMTHYIRYEYDETDINSLLDQGKVRWTFNKTIKLKTNNQGSSKRLPDNTDMVLVDPNGNADKVYYSKAASMQSIDDNDNWALNLKSFKENVSKTGDNYVFSGNSFNFASFNKMIEASIVECTGDTYKPVTLTSEQIAAGTGYDAYRIANGNTYYYQYTPGSGTTGLKVNNDLYEDYYISIKVPNNKNIQNELYYYYVELPDKLLLASNIIEEAGAALSNIKSAGIKEEHECKILISELFAHDEAEGNCNVAPETLEISAVNNKISVDLDAVVTPAEGAGASVYYLDKTKDKLYHSFYITLNRKTKNGIENDIQALQSVSAKYSIIGYVKPGASYNVAENPDNYNFVSSNPQPDSEGVYEIYLQKDASVSRDNIDIQGSYINVQTIVDNDVSKVIENLQTIKSRVKISASVTMEFNEEELAEEFPEHDSAGNYGVYVQAKSNLSFDKSTLSHSNMSYQYPADSKKYYYKDVLKPATLLYSSRANDHDAEDNIGDYSGNQSTLGLNGRSADEQKRESMPVRSEGFYNVANLNAEHSSEAKYLRMTFSMKKKINDSEMGIYYDDIEDMTKYIEGNVNFKLVLPSESSTGSKNISLTITPSGNKLTAVFPLTEVVNGEEVSYVPSSGLYDVMIDFNAKTGAGFKEYTNYEIDLSASLYDGEIDSDDLEKNRIALSEVSDYLIYTNAKINPEYIYVTSGND